MSSRIQQLQSDAEEAVRFASLLRSSVPYLFPEAINWTDLKPHVEYSLYDDNEYKYRVFLEEASPYAYQLQRFVRQYLINKGWSGVEVYTEW